MLHNFNITSTLMLLIAVHNILLSCDDKYAKFNICDIKYFRRRSLIALLVKWQLNFIIYQIEKDLLNRLSDLFITSLANNEPKLYTLYD